MDLLNQITGGGSRDELDDFTRRYDQGDPWDGISDDEAVSQYRRVAPNLDDDTYEESAREAFSRLSPQQRAQLGQHMGQRASEQGLDLGSLLGGAGGAMGGLGGMLGGGGGQSQGGFDDPSDLARMARGMHRQQPGLLEQVLGGGGGGAAGGLGGGIGKAALAGIAAMAFKKVAGGR